MSMFTVSDECVRCGLCSRLCVTGIVHWEDGRKPFVPPEREGECIRCGQCAGFCPKSCCYLDFQKERPTVDAGRLPDAESAELFLRSRRSIRRYKSEPVPEDIVRRIFETARYAPTATNRQPVRWAVSMTRERTRAVGLMVEDVLKRQASETPTDARSQKLLEALAKADPDHDLVFRGAPQLAIAVVDRSHFFPEDAALALTYFELAAHALGVGCCWAGFFTHAARQSAGIQKAVGVREDERIVGAQMFGYPDQGRCRILPPRKETDISWI